MKNGPYELVLAPDDYSGKKYRGKYVYEHHLVYWKHTGKLTTQDFEIHHKNGNHRDNRISNLELLHRKDHQAFHSKARSLAAIRNIKCAYCKNRFEIRNSDLNTRRKQNASGRFYCGRNCTLKYQREILKISMGGHKLPDVTVNCSYCAHPKIIRGSKFNRWNKLKKRHFCDTFCSAVFFNRERKGCKL